MDQSLTSLSFSGYPLEFQELLIATGNQPGSVSSNTVPPGSFGIGSKSDDDFSNRYKTGNKRYKTGNKLENFIRRFIPPASESNSPYVREGVYTDPFDDSDSVQSKIKSMFTFSSPDDIAKDIKKKLDEKESKNKKTDDNESIFPPPQTFADFMGMKTKDYYEMLQGLGEKTANRNMLRAGIADLAGSPLIGGQAALEAAKNVGALTLGNMGAMAAQNRVLEANPVKTRFAGRYFR
tara:strand:+ start:2153 stop:2860 length:708 start_codon:yes stop_codon:yes gene_type:complete